jgi:hypothetical protein
MDDDSEAQSGDSGGSSHHGLASSSRLPHSDDVPTSTHYFTHGDIGPEDAATPDQVMKDILKMVSSLGLQSASGYVHEALHYLRRKDDPHAVCAFGSSLAHGAHVLHDYGFAGMSFAARLQALKSRSTAELAETLVLEGSKTAFLRMHAGDSGHRGKAYLGIGFNSSVDQADAISHIHLAFASCPNMVALVPSGGEAVYNSISDMLLYHSPVRWIFSTKASVQC